MIYFVNAKINIGLDIVAKRADGYHLLETVFYPVGKYNGTPRNPEPFGDMLEISCGASDTYDYFEDGMYFRFTGRPVDCPPEKNLVVKAARVMYDAWSEDERRKIGPLTIILEKHIPDGAGLGGGSADATFVLKAMNDLCASRGVSTKGDDELERLAIGLGADCPVFVCNQAAYAEGIGEKLQPVDDFLKGFWAVIVKPDIYISTREAFSGVVPERPAVPLRDLIGRPMEEWRHHVRNGFEKSLFPKFPELKIIKELLYDAGAVYASLTGSGAALYGLFHSEVSAREGIRLLEEILGQRLKIKSRINLCAL